MATGCMGCEHAECTFTRQYNGRMGIYCTPQTKVVSEVYDGCTLHQARVRPPRADATPLTKYLDAAEDSLREEYAAANLHRLGSENL